MTQTLNRDPADTAVIQYDRHSYRPGGIVHLSPWSPRTDLQSPDLRPPTDEYAIIARRLVDEVDEADPCADWSAREAASLPVLTLAEVMPQPEVRPDDYRCRHRRAVSPWLTATLGFAAGAAGGVTVLTVAVFLAGGPR